MDRTPLEKLSYSIGALLYVPAIHRGIAEGICRGKYPHLSSIAFCFEDALLERTIPEAEVVFLASLDHISAFLHKNPGMRAALPHIFVRVRSPDHLAALYGKIRPYRTLLTGFVLPKYDPDNAAAYEREILRINREQETSLYVMPTLETEKVMHKETRLAALGELQKRLEDLGPLVLNVRVGGNDFCGLFGLRRNDTQTIYDIGVVRDALTDIINLFGRDHVVSGPVWEYFGPPKEVSAPKRDFIPSGTPSGGSGDDRWRRGLEREMALDRLNGFIGKTAIHPSQVPIILGALRVSADDYEDAAGIVNWKENLGVASSPGGRMNEARTHLKWARKILLLADIYGVVYTRAAAPGG